MRTHKLSLTLCCATLLWAAFSVTGCVDEQETLPDATIAGLDVHPDGWTNPSSDSFHGKAVRASGWKLSTCQTCHGKQYTGGIAGKSCLSCHSQADGPENCSNCHGSGLNPAPPKDIDRNTATTNRGVGAHQAHLVADAGKVLKCEECHTVPTAFGSIGHIDTTQFAEVMLDDTLANTTTDNGAVVPDPVYDPTTLTCSSVYCHGTFKNGNTTNTPVWTDASSAACGTCHGDRTKSTVKEKAHPKSAADGGTHPPDTQCQWCHSTIDGSGVIISAANHIDGKIDLKNLAGDCSACHGSATNAAPPADLQGDTAVTAQGVGAHQAHLTASGARVVACTECHTVPTSTYQAGHLDSERPAEVMFNGTLAGLATTGVTPSPSYSSTTASCSSVYCHGMFKNGNQSNAPVWNSSAGTAAQCGSCHGDVTKSTTAEKARPTGTHPAYTECQWCHTSVTAGPVFANASDHIDGTVPLFQWSGQADCSHCHGSSTNAAPPNDLSGNVTSPKVGAHQAHLNPSRLSTVQVACTECHTVPSSLDYSGSDGHLDGTLGVELTFDTLARKQTDGGAVAPNPVYTSASLSCGSVYCHGTFKNGNLTNAPVWNDTTTVACGSCHGNATSGNPRPGGNHSTSDNCGICHTVAGGGPAVATYDVGAGTWAITNKDVHMNGKLNVFSTERDPWP